VRILSRYFAARFLGLFAGILFASVLTIIIVEMLLNLDDMLGSQGGGPGILHYLFLRVPSYYLRELVPIASFAAAFFTLGLSARGLEIVAMKAGGVSPYRVLPPILRAASLIALSNFALSETWIVQATRNWNDQQSGGGPAITYGHGSFWYHRGRTIYNISSTDPSQRALRGVTVYDLDLDGQLVRSIEGKHVHTEDNDHWRFDEAIIRRYDPRRPDAPIRLDRVEQLSLHVGRKSELARANVDLGSLSLRQLVSYIDIRRQDQSDVHRPETVLYARLGEPVSILVFVLLAIPLGLRVEDKRGFGWPALWGIVTLAAYFTLRNISNTLASEGVLAASTSAIAVLGIFALGGCWGIIRSRS
jgi:lipopolysaccharide export system permease protein